MKSIGWMLDDMYNDLYEKMQREGYDRDSGWDALVDQGEIDMAHAWHEWWDAGDE